MATNLDTEVAGANEVISLAYVYEGIGGSGIGAGSVEAMAGIVNPSVDGMRAIKAAIQSAPELAFYKGGYAEQTSSPLGGASGYSAWVVDCFVLPNAAGTPYPQLLAPIQAVPVGIGLSLTLAQAGYGDPSDDVVYMAQQVADGGPSLWADLFAAAGAPPPTQVPWGTIGAVVAAVVIGGLFIYKKL